ncbi:MAG: cisplatin damage response ATP-dependent DNA ligase [Geminicoccaceae bacterium]|nr:cisplatin damage response ATP-dependent DNA ligase [Geminicoccaceae bacterium]MCS7268173.1 cisplatin damage response ATP-dependent DNA ligase [Geminicoccaceae bacterium]MDW8125362.1 cisplatin damage response ATP-dependent DNA ligase [Geminicoccaceae bacterium]MDW8342119.1 cisplatin damage response ATP-dependent DNA ligase [Geminicoccaceae bacterium]MDW8444044.1 cisplatin damage response ATP-dependent DNA ligase [Acetobacteraceae bacterium]
MQAFAELLERLLHAPQRTAKLALLCDYLRRTPDPDRGWALAALLGTLELPHAKPALVRALSAERSDPVLFAWSYDYVGDLAETAALLWPEPASDARAAPPRLSEAIAALAAAPKSRLPALLADLLDRLDATGRWALLKLLTGGLRVGVSVGLVREALARLGGVDPVRVEEHWHAQAPPYEALFAWLEGRAPEPAGRDALAFRPFMLAHPLDEADLPAIADTLADWAVEWKWDGIRVQLVAGPSGARLYSRSGEEIGASFPELLETARGLDPGTVLDGELVVMRGEEIGGFDELQQRLNRKRPSARILARCPVGLVLYDLLFESGEDLRPLPFAARRRRLESLLARCPSPRLRLSPLLSAHSLEELGRLRRAPPHPAIEGLVLKHKASPYRAGRVKGSWWKWKRDPFSADLVLLYAQRGHGKRSSFYSDYTFGAWREGPSGPELVPVAKAYSGYTDEELVRLDRWIRAHTIARFGPVRAVEPVLVFEIGFEGIRRSSRHKSGIALRFPRVLRIRWDKPAAEAERLAVLEALLETRARAAAA